MMMTQEKDKLVLYDQQAANGETGNPFLGGKHLEAIYLGGFNSTGVFLVTIFKFKMNPNQLS